MMKILTLLIAFSFSGGVMATETPGTQPAADTGIHKKLRKSTPADAAIDINTPRKTPSENIEVNTLAHRALPAASN